MRRSSYRRYTGRQGGWQSVLRKGAIVAALLLLLSFAAYQYFQDYLVFSGDGVRLELPAFLSFLNKEGEKPPAPGPQEEDPPLLVTGPAGGNPGDLPETTDDGPIASAGGNRPEAIRAIWLPYDRLAEEGYIEALQPLLKSGKINAVLVDLKLASGLLTYPTSVPEGIECGVSAEASAGFLPAVRKLREEGLYIIGRASAFRDNAFAGHFRALGVKTGSGVSWLDRENIRWLNPYNEGGAAYLSALADEAAGLPVDELLFTSFCFPHEGRLEYISYGDVGGTTKTEAVDQALSALLPREDHLAVSVLLTGGAAKQGADETAGQRAESFAQANANLYFEAAVSDVKDGFSGFAGLAALSLLDEGKAVPVVTVKDGAQTREAFGRLMERGFVLIRQDGAYDAADFS